MEAVSDITYMSQLILLIVGSRGLERISLCATNFENNEVHHYLLWTLSKLMLLWEICEGKGMCATYILHIRVCLTDNDINSIY